MTSWTTAYQASLSFMILRKDKSMYNESVMISNLLIPCCPLLLLLSVFPSIRVFSNLSAVCIRWPNYWSFSFSISPSNKYSGLISLGLIDLISLQSKGLSSFFSSTIIQKATIFRLSAFFMVQVSHPYTTTGKIIDLTIWTFLGKVMSLLFNMLLLSRFVIAFLPRS